MFAAFIQSLYRFLGSLKLAVVLLSSLAVACTFATICESKYGPEEAKRLFYGTLWFTMLLTLLATNILVAALHRYPWQKRHTGFLVTHAGLIILLIGAMIGNHFGLEGQIGLVEGGQGRNYFIQDSEVVRVVMPDRNIDSSVPVDFERYPLAEGMMRRISVAKTDVTVDVHHYFPHTREVLVVREGGAHPNPAIHFKLQSEIAGMSIDQWLIAHMPGHDSVDFGPARIRFVDERAMKDKGLVHLSFDNQHFEFSLDDNIGETVQLAETVSVRVREYFPDFRMDADGPVTASQEPNNPAVVLELTRPKGKSIHFLFADHPELVVANSTGGIHRDVAASYEFVRPTDRSEIIFSVGDDGKLRYTIFKEKKITASAEVEIGKDISPGWMDMRFRVERFIERGVPVHELRAAEPTPMDTEKFPTLVATVRKGEESEDVWLRWGTPQTLHLGGEHLTVAYGYKTVPLGFTIRCEEFTAGKYEGTQTPSSFTSEVVIEDPKRGITQKAKIWMNHPFTYNGFKLSQASYRERINGEPDQTFLQALKDPGWPLKAVGSTLIVIGIITMFYIKPFLTKKSKSSDGKSSSSSLSSSKPKQTAAATAALALSVFVVPVFAAEPVSLDFTNLESIAIQEGGRKKPLDTFARETMQTITGKTRFRVAEGEPKREPMDLMLAIMFEKGDWSEKKLIWAPYGELKEQLGLHVQDGHVSYDQLAANEPLIELVGKAQDKQRREANPRFTRLETEALQLANRMSLFRSLLSGDALAIVPHPSDPEGAWVTPLDAQRYYPGEKGKRVLDAFVSVGKAYVARDNETFVQASAKLHDELRKLSPKVYPSAATLARETHYNQFHPFRKAWIAYLAAFLFGLVTIRFKGRGVYWSLMGLCLVGFALHIYGFVLRCTIAGRPPVTNMYESVVWVSFGAVLFALILELIFKPRLYVMSACAAAVLGLILADSLPAVLNPSIQPLVPVLRDNFWLTVHVLTITLGYAAFLLALALGHVVMGAYLFKPDAKPLHSSLTGYLYRALQIGVLFLAAGTILGGVWANYSWGRFWGWDPKETWALIALLGYLVVLHGRFSGWMGNFALGVASILCFLGVLMAWYGVNFVLGTGLHSYGFGTGGYEYVAGYVILEVILVGAATLRYKKLQPANFREQLLETEKAVS